MTDAATTKASEIVAAVEERRHTINLFRQNVAAFFEEHPKLRVGNPPAIHSVKSRMKSEDSIRAKVARKVHDGDLLAPENIFLQITDFAGVRVLHLFQEQFADIHAAISLHVAQGEWVLHEPPKAYTWDPDAEGYFKNIGLETYLKDSRYTSVHYVVRPRTSSPACCEIQVRTLWEEIWGEIDHTINYPKECKVRACVEQIRVLARLVATGTRLGDSILGSYREEAAPEPCNKGSDHANTVAGTTENDASQGDAVGPLCDSTQR
jgi:putative GTP pyrophosphokinase